MSEDERRFLEACGWEPVDRDGETVWRRPESPYLYPRDVALRLAREGASTGDGPRQADEGAA